MRILLPFALLFFAGFLSAQPTIYNDNTTLITGTWVGNGTLTETTAGSPYEGTKHYQFTYNYTNWWAGYGLNMDNWGGGAPRDFSGYSHIRIAYKGLSGAQTLSITLRNGTNFGNEVTIGTISAGYTVVDISMVSLLSGSPVSANAIREINISVGGVQVSNGTVYIDDVKLVNINPAGQAASATTMARAASLGTGLNTSNWLEAYWLLPFNAYPETNKYNRAKMVALRNAGFDVVRLPVIFERLGSTTPPYDLDFNHPAFALVDSAIVWANDLDFKLIIDNHHGYNLTNSNYAIELPRLEAVWQQLTDHYNYLDPDRFFFELYNEPTPDISNSNFATVANSLLDVIRANESQTHSVFVGGNGWNSGSGLTSFSRLDDPDVIYTFHCYDPYFFTHQGMSWTSPAYFPARTFPMSGEVAAIQQLMASVDDWGNTNSVPVSMGEFGCSTAADAPSRCAWIETMTDAAITEGLSAFYWDVITPSDAFGFYTGGIIDQAHVAPCFQAALGLYANLPLVLENFKVECTDKGNPQLVWTANADTHVNWVEIQHSNNGSTWTTIGELTQTPGLHSYSYDIAEPARFFRLKIADDTGGHQFSPILVNTCDQKVQVEVFPNPTTQYANIRLTNQDAALTQVTLYDMAGKLLQQYNFLPEQQQYSWAIPVVDVPAGVYQLTTELTDGTTWHEQIAISH